MAATILGRKVGMTRIYTEAGVSVPVTVGAAGPCFVSQIKSTQTDGYAAVRLAFDEDKPRRSPKPLNGHDAKAGLPPMRFHREFRVAEGDLGNYQVGQQVTVDQFEAVKFVDVVGQSKGKGFEGVMRRYGFKGLCA